MDSCFRRNDRCGVDYMRWPDPSTALRSAQDDNEGKFKTAKSR